MDNETKDITSVTGDIVTSFLARNSLPADQVPGFIKTVQAALTEGAGGGQAAPPISVNFPGGRPVTLPEGADPVKETVFPDHIVCLEDGAKLKMLRRHLETYHNLSPAQYRKKHNLPKDYPMVAPGYAQMRSKLAKEAGLGKPQQKIEPAPAPAKTTRRSPAKSENASS